MPATGAKLVAEAKKQCLPELTQSLLPKQGSYACQIDTMHALVLRCTCTKFECVDTLSFNI